MIKDNKTVCPIIRPVEKVEARIISPRGLSMRSGRRAPTSRYLGSMMVLKRGANIHMRKKIPKVTPRCPKSNIKFHRFFYCIYNKLKPIISLHIDNMGSVFKVL
jgi:hypothetical protein